MVWAARFQGMKSAPQPSLQGPPKAVPAHLSGLVSKASCTEAGPSLSTPLPTSTPCALPHPPAFSATVVLYLNRPSPHLCLLHEVSWVSAPLTALPRHCLVPAHGPVLGCVTHCPELQRTVCVASPSPCSDHGLREAGHTECALNEGNAPDHPQSGCDSNES